MATPLQNRSGKNAAEKPHNFANVQYGTHRSYRLSNLGGDQLMIPGPSLPGTGSKNEPPRAQDTVGQGDLGVERYMGSRSRLISTQSLNVGWVYASAGAKLFGDILFVRPNGKALKIGAIDGGVSPDVAPAALTVPLLLPPVWCLAPGEDIVFRPQPVTPATDPVAGTALYIPAFVDVDLINFRIPLDTAKQVVLSPPPGKVWQLPGNLDDTGQKASKIYPSYGMGILNLDASTLHGYKAYVSDGVSDVLFDDSTAFAGIFQPVAKSPLPDGGFFLPAGHSIKVSLDAAGPDVFFCATMAEYNQADVEDEEFATPTVVPPFNPE